MFFNLDMAVLEHQQREQRLPRKLERVRLTQSIAQRPGWMARQASRALNALRRGMIILSQRLASERDGQPMARFKETGG